jgi:hypothetical protein
MGTVARSKPKPNHDWKTGQGAQPSEHGTIKCGPPEPESRLPKPRVPVYEVQSDQTRGVMTYTIALHGSESTDLTPGYTSCPRVSTGWPGGEPRGMGGPACTHTGCMNPGIVGWTRVRDCGTRRTTGAWWDWDAPLRQSGYPCGPVALADTRS